MADFTYGGQTSADPSSAGFSDIQSKLVTWAGAVTSLALMVGVVVWGGQIVMRDVSGVPVVQAIDGPMRVQPNPEDVGGKPAAHQGLAVNDVAAVGTAQDAPDRLVLAPEPVDISENDPAAVLAALVEAASSDAEAGEVTPVAESVLTAAIQASETGEATKPPTPAELLALVDQIANGIVPLTTAEPAAEEGEVVASLAPQAADKPKFGLAKSLRPQLRPASFKPAAVAEPSQPVPSASALDVGAAVTSVITSGEVDAASLPAGTRLVQLGAYETADIAREEWQRIGTKFSGYLDDKSRVVQKATSGGRTFYRLRAMGFQDLSDARRFCSALVAENAACIPVVTR
ncbi:SPOR domain-containing protein [Algirhabdus cladophorae]|uniref:SPOR domain-containing protein n=1 Tax=Algirhabdus cladophorae TaxID=3377108 RepID=UPI003B84B492